MSYSATITITQPKTGLLPYLEPLKANRGRSAFDISQDGSGVKVVVEAQDATAFRAAMNSLTQTLSVFETAQKQ